MQSLPGLRWADYSVGSLDVFLRPVTWKAWKTPKEKNKKHIGSDGMSDSILSGLQISVER